MNVELFAILDLLLKAAIMLLAAGMVWLAVRKDRRSRLRSAMVRVECPPQNRKRSLITPVMAQTGPAVSRRHTGPPVPWFSLDPTPPDGSRPGQM